jgi:PucR C-terminal helix-turn-helix domain/GGDEF-like domain
MVVSMKANPPSGPGGRVRAATVRRLERAMGTLGTAAVTSMDQRLPWFRAMPPENRSWVGLVAQAGVAAFVDWIKHPEKERPAVTGEVFGTAPRELTRAVTLQQTVEMVRVVIDVVEAQVNELAAPGGEVELREAVLRYTREVAFGAAQVYARAAEARGAWDARLEALVVDEVLHGEVYDRMHSWTSALRWSSSPVVALVGHTDETEPEAVIDELRMQARRTRHDLLAGVQGNRLVVLLGGVSDPLKVAARFAGRFGPGPVVVGPAVPDLQSASHSARVAMAGLRAAPAWPDAPRPVHADDLLPERVLDGDQEARHKLISEVYEPLLRSGSPLLDTLSAYLEQGLSLEATARMLFVHPNTVRYRLRRIAELTGHVPGDGRGTFALQIGVTIGRLEASRLGRERLAAIPGAAPDTAPGAAL